MSKEIFLSAQEQLDRNKLLSPKKQKYRYLLSSLVKCKWCGRSYHGEPEHDNRYYRCKGRSGLIANPPCRNKRVLADWLEGVVWDNVKEVLLDPKLLKAEIEKMYNSGESEINIEHEIKLNEQRFNTLDESETRVLRIYTYTGGDIEKATKELKRIRKEMERVKADIANLYKRLDDIRKTKFDIQGAERYCGLARHNIENLTFDEKRLALEAIKTKVWIDGKNITIEGLIPVLDSETVAQPS